MEELRAALSGASPPPPAPLRTGVPVIDARLPGGGFGAGLHEVWPGRGGAPCEAAMVLFAACALASGSGPVVWALRRRDLFAPALAEVGLSPARVIYAEAGDEASVLAVAEEALRHGGLAGVVCETARLSLKASRRLQLAGEATGTPGFALRRGVEAQGTSCLTRWRVEAAPSGQGPGLPGTRWRVSLTRSRRGQPGDWLVGLDGEAPRRLRLAEAVADRAAGPDARRLSA